MFPIACYQATGQYFAHSAQNDRFPAILNAQNPAIPSAHPQGGILSSLKSSYKSLSTKKTPQLAVHSKRK